MAKSIKILDCTLRDGGYINNWDFGYENIETIVQNLFCANVDFIECGFLKKNIPYSKNKTLFNNTAQFLNIINEFEIFKTIKNKLNNSNTPKKQSSKFCLMINYGDVDIDDIKENKNNDLFLRICFKKDEIEPALEFCRQLKEKKYGIFIFPMYANLYSEADLEKLAEKINKINPFAFSIVDTTGGLDDFSLGKIFKIIDKKLNPDISLCFHSHNNLNLSYKNALSLINQNTSRSLIFDGALFGMGRGAGNLKIELIAKFINENINLFNKSDEFDTSEFETSLINNKTDKRYADKKYNIDLISKTINDCILPIYQKTPWSASVPYELSAQYGLHPNYAKFVIEMGLEISKIKEIFNLISDEKKCRYDENYIKKLL